MIRKRHRYRLAAKALVMTMLFAGCATVGYEEPLLPADQAATIQAAPSLRLKSINDRSAPAQKLIRVAPGVAELDYIFSGYVGYGFRDTTAVLPTMRCYLRAGHRYRPVCDISKTSRIELWLEESADGHTWRRIPHLPSF